MLTRRERRKQRHDALCAAAFTAACASVLLGAGVVYAPQQFISVCGIGAFLMLGMATLLFCCALDNR